MTDEELEIVVFNDKSWVRVSKYMELKNEIKDLKAQIEKMKNCVNCGSYIDYVRPDNPDYKCRECEDGSEWRLKDD